VEASTTTDLEKDRQANRKSRYRRRSRYHSEARLRRYRQLLIGISILFALIYIFTWFHISGKSGELQQSTVQLRKLEATLKDVSTELETVRSERDALVQDRIPNLLPLTYDEAINIGEEYVRNVIFTLVKNGKKETYEYRLVLHNDSLGVVRPRVEIFLFNDIGIQIGVAEVTASNATTDVDRIELDPGEVRSYSATINMIRDEEPSYFLLTLSESSLASPDKMRKHLGKIISP
jgi:hypothetical protein